jgi:hypothetical protein
MEPEFTHNIGMLLNELEKFTEIPENVKKAIDLFNNPVGCQTSLAKCTAFCWL